MLSLKGLYIYVYVYIYIYIYIYIYWSQFLARPLCGVRDSIIMPIDRNMEFDDDEFMVLHTIERLAAALYLTEHM